MGRREELMEFPQISSIIGGVRPILAGVLLINWPRILSWVVGVYLIIFGILAVLAIMGTTEFSLSFFSF